MKEIFQGVFREGKKIYTKNIVPGKSIYGEYRIKINGVEYREWDPNRSKAAAAMRRGLRKFPIQKDSSILYLGIANGTTSSHFCDIIGEEGVIIGIDVAPKMFEKLLEVAEKRESIIPILADARHPEKYKEYFKDEEVDVLYQDVSQRDQVEIFLKNTIYLKKGGYAILALKAMCIDVTQNPQITYREALKQIKKKLKVLETVELGQYEKDHLFIVCKKE